MNRDVMADYEIGDMQPSERNYVLDSWMRSSRWDRNDIYRALDDGETYVARDGQFILGWICTVKGRVAFGQVRPQYRELGVFRSLWLHAGSPGRVMSPGTKAGYDVVSRLKRGKVE